MKILIDMNLPPRLARLFAESGIESAHWSSLGTPDAADSSIMEYARKHDYVVLTYDLDFSAILAATQDTKPSVIQLRTVDTTPETVVVPVVKAIEQVGAELQEGALLTIDLNRARLRLLPLRRNE